MFAERTAEELDAIKKRWATKGNVLEAPKMIEAKARDMLRHYVDSVMPNGFKAQVVATSRLAAVRYREAFLHARDELVAEIEKLDPAHDDSRGHRPGRRAADQDGTPRARLGASPADQGAGLRAGHLGQPQRRSRLAAVVRWGQAQDQHRRLQAAPRRRVRRPTRARCLPSRSSS